MTEYEGPSEGEHLPASSRPTGYGIPATHSRRRLLQALSIGGSLALAGCGQSDSTTTTGTAGVSGQTFRAPTRNDPEKTSFFFRTGWWKLQTTAYAPVVKEPASYNLRRFLWQPGVWINGELVPERDSSIQYNWIEEPIKISPTEVRVTIRDDAKWSDGHPITGKDIAHIPIEQTLLEHVSPPAYAPDAQNEPERVLSAFDDFEITEKSVAYRSSEGHFEQFWDRNIALRLGPIVPALLPTHIEPFDAYADAVIETARRAQAGEIYPWWKRGPRDPDQESLIQEHLADSKYVKKFSKPEDVLAIGPWDLVELDGKNFVFEKNPHHRHADTINFKTVRFEYTPSDKRQHAALKADRLDYGSPGTTPQTVVDSLPDNIKTLRVPGWLHTGNELRMNFNHSALGTREVRLAIMYALDQPSIAKNFHQSTAKPVTTPGGDCWDSTQYMSQDRIEENFITYSQDREQATGLMREAGYTKDGGKWVNADGEPLTLTLPTPSDAPRWEPTVASQLSAFGIQTTVQTLGEKAFGDRVEKGEFAIWPSNDATAVSHAPHTLYIWVHAAENPQQYGIYPENQFGNGEFSDDDVPIPHTEDRYSAFTIQAPPVGKPTGPLKEYHPAALGLAFWTNPPKAEFRRRVKIGMWLSNWFAPTIPINKTLMQHFIDEAHWQWPTDSTSWQSFTDGDYRWPGEVLGSLALRANLDDPE